MKRLLIALMVVLLTLHPAWASVPDTTYFNSYVGNGATTVYAYTWRLIDPSQLIVQVNGAALAPSAYTVFQNTNGIGGTVTFNSAPGAALPVLIQRNSDYLQTNSFANNGAIPLKTLETMLDKLTIIGQQLRLIGGGVSSVSDPSGSIYVSPTVGAVQMSLPDIGVTPRAYNNMNATVDSKGRVITASDGVGGSGGGAVSSVSNVDGTLTIAPTTTAVVASLAALPSGKTLVGNGSNKATAVNLSNDATMDNAGAVTLKNSGVTAGQYTNTDLTVDAQGRITSAQRGDSAFPSMLSTVVRVPVWNTSATGNGFICNVANYLINIFAAATTQIGAAAIGSFIELTTSAANDSTALFYSYSTFACYQAPQAIWTMKTGALATDIQNCRIWSGAYVANTLFNTSDIAGTQMGFRFDTIAGDTTWQCITKNATTRTVVNSGVTVAADTVYILGLDYRDLTKVDFYINGVKVATSTTNLPTTFSAPSATLLYWETAICTSNATAKHVCLKNHFFSVN